ncbi:MAG: cytochrome c oxidase subunit II [Legionellales bacterium]|nr:cytochrome c oxidase subunit II [Legionellales bacterium]
MKWFTQLNRIGWWLCLSVAPLLAWADDYRWGWNMPKGVTPLSQDIYWLHMLIFWICVIIGIVVFGVLIYSLFQHRKSKGAVAANFHANTKVELIWTIIPIVILVAMAIPATQVLSRMDDTNQADITIDVIGYQWKWEYKYMDQNIAFFSNLATPPAQIRGEEPKGEWYLLEVDRPLVLPVNKKIRFRVTSNDVIHSWWMPELGIKRDAIPGFLYEAWARIDRPGTYRGQCAELCGVYHGYMPIVVEAVSEEEFEQWVAQQKKAVVEQEAVSEQPSEWTYAQLMTEGKQQYDKYCAACHGFDGKGIPPLFPALKASSVATNPPISRHIELILHGVPGTAMQGYQDQLTDAEIAAIVTYERNAWENNTGSIVQPGDVKSLR